MLLWFQNNFTPSTRWNQTSYWCSFLVIQQTHVNSMYSLCICIQEKKETTLLAHKYFCEQDVGNDKHSSWLLNRSARQCVVRSACAGFSELCVRTCAWKWSRWEWGVINIEPPPRLLVCSCLWFFLLFISLSACVFPPRRYLQVSRWDPGSDTPGWNVPPFPQGPSHFLLIFLIFNYLPPSLPPSGGSYSDIELFYEFPQTCPR